MAGLLVVGKPTPVMAGSDLMSAELESAIQGGFEQVSTELDAERASIANLRSRLEGLGDDIETLGSEPPTADASPTVVAVPASDGGPHELVIAAVAAAVAALGLAGVALGIAMGRNRAPETAQIPGEPVVGAG
jgi:hypothetical protein